MLNSRKNVRALHDKKNILTLVLSKRNFLNETKTIPPPPSFKLNGRSLIWFLSCLLHLFISIYSMLFSSFGLPICFQL